MIWIVIALALVVAVLCVALYFQIKGSRDQAGEQEALLRDYQRRVDEQQQLLEDYRSLQKNFENVGEGYEQALDLYDKMEENSRKLEERNAFLEKQNADLQTASNSNAEAMRTSKEFIQQVMQKMVKELDKMEASAAAPLAGLVYSIQDANDLGSEAAIELNDNIMAEQVAKQAVAESAIDKCQYFTFELKVSPQAASMLHTNMKQAGHALALMLDNAKKFTTDGSVTLSVDADLQESKVTYTVEDTGMGVPANEADHIFEPYVKLNSYFDGQGLGLTFARSIARRLGGDLVLDTTNTGRGARFVMTLPM
ncbi:MAG: sensor histidine kinase [Prevotella sp.]|nr:sensor histidine kinase [Prevotella sp.]